MIEKQTDTTTATRTAPHQDKRPKQLPPFHVVLHNDDDHSFEYVIGMLQKLFGHPIEKGFQIADRVHQQDRAIVLTTTKEHAELKRDQIHAFGPDVLVAGCSGSMTATIEPAEFGDDGDDDAD